MRNQLKILPELMHRRFFGRAKPGLQSGSGQFSLSDPFWASLFSSGFLRRMYNTPPKILGKCLEPGSVRKFCLLIICVLFLNFSLYTKDVHAFAFTYGEKIMEVPEEELLAWKTPGKIPKTSMLETSGEAEAALNKYFGKPAATHTDFVLYKFSPQKIYSFIETLASQVNIAKTEPALEINGDVATKFSPPTTGLTLNPWDTTLMALKTLETSATGTPLVVNTELPQNSLASTNNLGIKELVGFGQSNFRGSPKNRIHNIKVGVGKMTGVIVKPGEEFSFNKYLGPVEKEFGFLPELVIKSEGTVPELGGGLCQVSSTTFRAAMNAGLPITQRKNHSYAVQYYAPQGTDATIYPGVIDIKFLNDTPGNMLIWPYFKDTYTLVFEFWGTKDARKVTLEKPIVYDRKSDGSMKATWTRIVENNGETSTSTFRSVYLSPALFHKEETFIAGSTTPPAAIQTARPHSGGGYRGLCARSRAAQFHHRSHRWRAHDGSEQGFHQRDRQEYGNGPLLLSGRDISPAPGNEE